MFFQKKLERSLKWQKEQNQAQRHEEVSDDHLPSMEDLVAEEQEIQLEKSDVPALIVSALITFVPLVLIILGVLCAIMFLLS